VTESGAEIPAVSEPIPGPPAGSMGSEPQPARSRLDMARIRAAVAPKAMAIVLILIVFMFTILSPRFATVSNGQTILELASVLALLAIGQTFVILTGGIDLSVGSVVALTGVVAAKIVQGNPDMFVPAVVGGVGVGLICGLINGTLVARFRVPSFIVTLGMMTSASGLAYYISNGSPVSNLPKNYLAISTVNLASEGGFQLKIPVVLMVIAFAIAWLILTRTAYGMRVYAVGGNSMASRIAGVRVNWVLVSAYAVSGTLAGIAGVILAARVTAGIPATGTGYELDSIAAVVVGGASLSGGVGTIGGTALGLFLIQTLNNGFDMLNISSFVQKIIKGALIVGAVYLTSRRRD
jgi:ribose transport system permease protein